MDITNTPTTQQIPTAVPTPDSTQQNLSSGASTPIQANSSQGGAPTASSDKIFTQEQLSNMLANEKRTARQALLKELGFETTDDKSFADTLSNIKKTLDAGKTQQQLDQEARTKAEGERDTARADVARLEMKIAAMTAGVKPDCVDDAIALAAPKVSETMPLDKVLAELKTKYASMFTDGSISNTVSGTGGSTNPPNKSSSPEGMGKRLAQQHKPATTKSSFFKN